jgi:hypothetical protein
MLKVVKEHFLYSVAMLDAIMLSVEEPEMSSIQRLYS